MRKHYLSEQIRGLSAAARTDQEGDLLNQVARELDSMWECLNAETAPVAKEEPKEAKKQPRAGILQQEIPEASSGIGWRTVLEKLPERDARVVTRYVPMKSVSPEQFSESLKSMKLQVLPFCGVQMTDRIRDALKQSGL